MIANFPHKDYSLLKPIMEHGMDPVIKGMIYPAAGFVELIFILFYNIILGPKLNYLN